MRFVCWIRKDTDTHSEYVLLNAFPRKLWLRERASMFRLYVRCLLCLLLVIIKGVYGWNIKNNIEDSNT